MANIYLVLVSSRHYIETLAPCQNNGTGETCNNKSARRCVRQRSLNKIKEKNIRWTCAFSLGPGLKQKQSTGTDLSFFADRCAEFSLRFVSHEEITKASIFTAFLLYISVEKVKGGVNGFVLDPPAAVTEQHGGELGKGPCLPQAQSSQIKCILKNSVLCPPIITIRKPSFRSTHSYVSLQEITPTQNYLYNLLNSPLLMTLCSLLRE